MAAWAIASVVSRVGRCQVRVPASRHPSCIHFTNTQDARRKASPGHTRWSGGQRDTWCSPRATTVKHPEGRNLEEGTATADAVAFRVKPWENFMARPATPVRPDVERWPHGMGHLVSAQLLSFASLRLSRGDVDMVKFGSALHGTPDLD